MDRSVVVCRAHRSGGNPVGPSGVSMLADAVKWHWFSASTQLAVVCTSTLPPGTGNDTCAVSIAADAGAAGVIRASVNHVAADTAQTPANCLTDAPFVGRMLAGAYSS